MESLSEQININKLISLTFDESPEVRKHAAKSLGTIDDPGAIFALVELSYDKEPSVRDVALEILEKRKQTEAEVMSFAEMFSDKSQSTPPAPDVPGTPALSAHDAKEKVLQPITKLFEKHLGKERAAAVRSKMMPTIEKIYLKTVTNSNTPQSAHGTLDQQQEAGRKVMQEFLTSYLEVISGLDQVGSVDSSISVQTTLDVPKEPVSTSGIVVSSPVEVVSQIDSPPGHKKTHQLVPASEISQKPSEKDYHQQLLDVEDYQFVAELKEEQGISKLPDTFFKKAYEVMMQSDGDEDVMKKEMKHMVNEAQREIGLAFKFARKKFKEINLTNIAKIKDGMRNINTDVLTVKSVGSVEYKKTKKETGSLIRLLLLDPSENEGVVYLFEDRINLDVLRPGLKVKLAGAMAKSYDATGETVMLLGKKGNIYIIL
ncbi:HEAT repeat domain-containing protein [Candidatus Micrarchaeota archaeon]|nr:HEAT repeat domain-containing protein [Candidatus Micrarchaeota archaeon]